MIYFLLIIIILYSAFASFIMYNMMEETEGFLYAIIAALGIFVFVLELNDVSQLLIKSFAFPMGVLGFYQTLKRLNGQ